METDWGNGSAASVQSQLVRVVTCSRFLATKNTCFLLLFQIQQSSVSFAENTLEVEVQRVVHPKTLMALFLLCITKVQVWRNVLLALFKMDVAIMTSLSQRVELDNWINLILNESFSLLLWTGSNDSFEKISLKNNTLTN